jgi:D-alanyl-D-alanine carboxypeptidase/D-alanyl-D-alanine-endopeptidase (penicillin-binding protein 4)
LGALLAIAIAGCGGGGHASTGAGATGASPVNHTAARRPRPVTPALARLRRALSRTLRLAGRGSGASIYDLKARNSLFVLRDGVKLPPASVEKLYTTIAVLRKLGPHARLRTTVLGTGHLGPGGVWHGNLYLRGGGDPTFGDGTFNRVWELGYGPTAAQLATQLTRKGIRRVTGTVIGDASLFDSHRGGPSSHFAPDIPDFGGQLSGLTYDHGATVGPLSPGAFAARQLTLTLRALHVQATASTSTEIAPRRAHRLAIVSSPPLSVLLALMNIPSDDLFAEMLTKQLGSRFANHGSIAAGARVISHAIAAYGLHPRIVDGSGLSRSDRSSPREIVAVLRFVWRTSIGHVLSASLPTVGVNGTVRRIGRLTAAQGHCIAKTGTLDDVTNLAGYCSSRGHHVLAFALLVDGPTNATALVLLGRMVAAIARY